MWELGEWISAGHCPPETLAEFADRLEVLWELGPPKMRVTGWGISGPMVTWKHDIYAPVTEVLVSAKEKRVPNPLAPLVNAWAGPRARSLHEPPRPGRPDCHGSLCQDTGTAGHHIRPTGDRPGGWGTLRRTPAAYAEGRTA